MSTIHDETRPPRQLASVLREAADELDRLQMRSSAAIATPLRITPTIERRQLPPIKSPGPDKFFDVDTYATVTAGKITADVVRLAYWDPVDGEDSVDIDHEVRINGLPDAGGLSDVVANADETLPRLAAVCTAAAELLAEVKR